MGAKNGLVVLRIKEYKGSWRWLASGKPHFVVFGDLFWVFWYLDEDWWLVGKSKAGICLTSKGVTRSLDVGGVNTGPLSRLEGGERAGCQMPY